MSVTVYRVPLYHLSLLVIYSVIGGPFLSGCFDSSSTTVGNTITTQGSSSHTIDAFEIIEGDSAAVTVVYPLNGMVDVPYDTVTFVWGMKEPNYELYVDTLPDLRHYVVKNWRDTSYQSTEELRPATTYYWRIDYLNQGRLITGDVNSFTTSAHINMPPTITILDSLFVLQKNSTGSVLIRASDSDGDSIEVVCSTSVCDTEEGAIVSIDGMNQMFEFSIGDIWSEQWKTLHLTVRDTGSPQRTHSDSVKVCINNPPVISAPDTVDVFAEQYLDYRIRPVLNKDMNDVRYSPSRYPGIYIYDYSKVEVSISVPPRALERSDQNGFRWQMEAEDIGTHRLMVTATDYGCIPVSDSATVILRVNDPQSLTPCTNMECDSLMLHNLFVYYGTTLVSDDRSGRVTGAEVTLRNWDKIPLELYALSELNKLTISKSDSIIPFGQSINTYLDLDSLFLYWGQDNHAEVIDSVAQISGLKFLKYWTGKNTYLIPPESFLKVSSIISLDLSGNGITELPLFLKEHPSLEILNLSKNAICNLTDEAIIDFANAFVSVNLSDQTCW